MSKRIKTWRFPNPSRGLRSSSSGKRPGRKAGALGGGLEIRGTLNEGEGRGAVYVRKYVTPPGFCWTKGNRSSILGEVWPPIEGRVDAK
ncbi:hypothetical protein KM043_009458 [Ampulex compressa]|nr:hypothetical protein KM043_009458 [Ampulex compressa]